MGGGLGTGYISRDGKAMAGTVIDQNKIQQPARWEGGRSWRGLGPLVPGAVPCGSSLSFAMGTSGDGRVVVGGGYYGTNPADPCDFFSAYRWEESTGYVLLPTQDGDYTRAHAVSADGHVVVGIDAALTGLWRGVKWVDGKHELIQGPVGQVVSAWAVNRDGTVIVGSGCTADLPNQPPSGWSWTAAGGVKCHTAEPPRWVPWVFGNSNNYNTYIRAVSDDGRVMGGDIEFDIAQGDEESVIWFDGEPVYLRDYLRDHGYPDAFEGQRQHGQDHRGVSRRPRARRPQRRLGCHEPLGLHRHPSGAGREVKRLLAFLSVLAAAPGLPAGTGGRGARRLHDARRSSA